MENTISKDRRRQRSSNRAEALSLQLDACFERGGLEALVVADAAGLLVASKNASEWRDDWMAAVLPTLRPTHPGEPVSGEPAARKLFTTRVEVAGQTLYVGALARSASAALDELAVAPCANVA